MGKHNYSGTHRLFTFLSGWLVRKHSFEPVQEALFLPTPLLVCTSSGRARSDATMSRAGQGGRYDAVQYHDPSGGMTDLSEGEMMDSAAEVVDAPLLLLRIAQSRAETTRLIDWIRGAGVLARIRSDLWFARPMFV